MQHRLAHVFWIGLAWNVIEARSPDWPGVPRRP